MFKKMRNKSLAVILFTAILMLVPTRTFMAYGTNTGVAVAAYEEGNMLSSGRGLLRTSSGALSVATNSAVYSNGDITAVGSFVSDDSVSDTGFKYSSAAGSSSGTVSCGSYDSSGSFSKSFAVGTDPDTYYVTAYAIDGDGNEVLGSTISVKIPVVTGNTLLVTTSGASYSNGYITADGYFSYGNSISSTGFVYSPHTSSPTLSNSKYEAGGNASTHGIIKGSFSVSDSYDCYYVRAYVTDKNGTVYGKAVQVEASFDNGGRPTVKTVSVDNVYSGGAAVTMRVTENGSSRVTDRGLVYSRSYSTPTLVNSEYYSVDGTTGSVTISLSGLSGDTKYYVRAYATNRYGTSYGSVKTFTTGSKSSSSSHIETIGVTGIMETAAEASGHIYDANSYKLKERGFVYSTSKSNPTTSDTKIYDTSSSLGRYSNSITGLTAGTTYYLRAYAETAYSTYYGNVIVFTTKSTKDATVAVVADSEIEEAFMPSAGNFEFKPDELITRGEVAQILYNLSDKDTGEEKDNETQDYDVTDDSAEAYTDIVDSKYLTAIEYALTRGYMKGYPDGYFRPDGTITRAEISEILCGFYDLGDNTGAYDFVDVGRRHWAYEYIVSVTEAGLLSEFADETFQPDNEITRAEMCVIFSMAEERSLQPLSDAVFTDVPEDYWAYTYIMNGAVPQQ